MTHNFFLFPYSTESYMEYTCEMAPFSPPIWEESQPHFPFYFLPLHLMHILNSLDTWHVQGLFGLLPKLIIKSIPHTDVTSSCPWLLFSCAMIISCIGNMPYLSWNPKKAFLWIHDYIWLLGTPQFYFIFSKKRGVSPKELFMLGLYDFLYMLWALGCRLATLFSCITRFSFASG